jgi:predicted outer membrane protein
MKKLQTTKLAVILTVGTCISALPAANGQDDTGRLPAGSAVKAAKQSDGQLSAADAQFVREAAKGSHMEVKLGELAKEKAQSETVKQLAESLVTDHTRSGQELSQLAARKGVTLPPEHAMGAQGGTSTRATSGLSSTAGTSTQPGSTDRSAAGDSSAKTPATAQGGTSPAAGASTSAGASTDRAKTGSDHGGDALRSLSGSDFDRAFVEHAIKDHQKEIASYERASKDCQDAEVKAFAAKQLPILRTHLQMAQAAVPSGAATPQK